MGKLVDSKERGAGAFILFALGFVGFVIAATGIVVGSPGGAILAWLLMLFVAGCYIIRARWAEM